MSKTIYKPEFIHLLANEAGLSKKETKRITECFLDCLVNLVSEGNEVEFIGFGKFSTIKAKARESYNFRAREKCKVPSFTKVKFKAGSKFKKACRDTL
jgi:DNA-binding protein HU-beta